MSNPNSVFKCAVLSCAYLTEFTEPRPQLRVLHGNGPVYSRVAGDIRRIVCERSQRECVSVGILAIEYQFANEVSTANVMYQVAELPTAERVVAEVLDNSASVGIRVRFRDLLLRQRRKTLEEEWPDFIGPKQIYDFFVRQHGVCKRAKAHQQNKQERDYAKAN